MKRIESRLEDQFIAKKKSKNSERITVQWYKKHFHAAAVEVMLFDMCKS